MSCKGLIWWLLRVLIIFIISNFNYSGYRLDDTIYSDQYYDEDKDQRQRIVASHPINVESTTNLELPLVTEVTYTMKENQKSYPTIDVSSVMLYDYMSNHVVGLVGDPVSIGCYGSREFLTGVLCYHYDETKLQGMNPKDMVILYYNESEGWYDTLPTTVDTDQKTVSVYVEQPGTYVLENGKAWNAVWNGDYEKRVGTIFPLDQRWKIDFDASDIERISDTSWYDASTTEFHIYNKEQLAGLVELVNGGVTFDMCSIYLENDIDLSNLSWAPIGVKSRLTESCFKGGFIGNGHTISNLCITSDQDCIGFFGFVGGYFVVDGLSLSNCNIQGNAYVGTVVGESRTEYINSCRKCYVSGKVFGEDCVGGLYGFAENVSINDCFVRMDVTSPFDCVRAFIGDGVASTIQNSSFWGNLIIDGQQTEDSIVLNECKGFYAPEIINSFYCLDATGSMEEFKDKPSKVSDYLIDYAAMKERYVEYQNEWDADPQEQSN